MTPPELAPASAEYAGFARRLTASGLVTDP